MGRAGAERGIAWVLNLEAEEELRHPGYTPSAKVQSRVQAMIPNIQGLVWEGDRVIGREAADAPGWSGRAWCPTPGALERLRAAGAEPSAAPSSSVLRRTNHRRFCAELGQTLEGARYCEDLRAVEERIARPSPSGAWLLKRPFGMSGAGRRRVRGAPDDDIHRWVVASLREDGLQVEPLVERLADFALHGFVHEDGRLVLGQPVRQRVDVHGAWLSTAIAPEGSLSASERDALRAEGQRTAEALHRAGYFGPFGIDAFRYRLRGRVGFNPRCEINARYAMGWAVGVPERPDRGESPDRFA